MFSRFFSNIHFRRVLCCLLALLTFGCCLSPALVQPAEAVAVADDVLIASLALLATSWAGVTFATNGGANTAISNLLQSKPAVKLSLAGLITKKLVVEGTKLLLTRDVRDAFETVLPEIKSFFQTESETVASTNDGSLSSGYVVGASYPIPLIENSLDKLSEIYNNQELDGQRLLSFVGCPFESIMISTTSVSFIYSLRFTSSGIPVYATKNSDELVRPSSSWGIYSHSYKGERNTLTVWTLNADNSHSRSNLNFLRQGDSASFTVLSASDSIPFQTSKEVDGTSALEILKPAPLYVVNPGGNEGGDGSSKPEIDFKKLGMIALEGLLGVTTLAGSQAQQDKDPGLKPNEMVNDLQQAMNGAGQNPNPNPDPQPQPQPQPEPAPDPDTPGGGGGTPPQFDQMVIPNLKDFFPFCIPGDIKKMIDALCAAPEAPKFTFATSFMGQVYSVNIDLSAWNGVAASVRYMVVAVYIAALAVATRKFIKW